MKAMVFLPAFLTYINGLPAEAEDAGQEFVEIAIHIRGNKTEAATLLNAAAKGTTVTGIVDFDSLSAVYGLAGIYRDDGMSSGFFGYRFRLTFPPEKMDVEVLVLDYNNLPYINSAKSAPPVNLGDRIRRSGGSKDARVRIPTKLAAGSLTYVVFSGMGMILYHNYLYDKPDPDPWEEEFGPMEGAQVIFYGLMFGGAVGFPLGVTAVDPNDYSLVTLLAGVLPGAGGLYFIESEKAVLSGLSLAYVYPIILSLAASELLRNPSENRRTSFGIASTPMGGLYAVTKLRF